MKPTVYQKKESWKLFDHIALSYDRLNRILSLNLDRSWRQMLSKHLPPSSSPLNLLDIATGTGDQIISLMDHNTNVNKATGIDPASKMLALAKKKIALKSYNHSVELIQGSALHLPFQGEVFDAASLTFGIRNIDDTLLCFQEALRVLKPGGRLLILEFSVPKQWWIRPFALAYMRTILPFIGGLFTKNKAAYTYLNDTIRAFPPPKEFCSRLEESGFCHVTALPLTFGVVTLYIGEKP